MATLLLFFDGIGVGRDDPEANPFAAAGVRRLAPLRGEAPDDGCSFRALDATLGVPGTPQSATGQTTLLTGKNAAALLGRHLPGLPNRPLSELLERDSLFRRLVEAGGRPTFANAYTRAHLESRRPRWSATTRMVRGAGVPFRMIDPDAIRGEALYHDFTGEWSGRRGIEAPRLDARAAARVLARLVESHDLVLYEYFLTDLAAHRGTRADREREAGRSEELVDACLNALELARHRLVVVSDHGNLEDGASRLHTTNPVPLLAWGRGAASLVESVAGMESVTPALGGGQGAC